MDLTQRARALATEIDDIVTRLSTDVWDRLPGYETATLDRTELLDAMRASMRAVLAALGERRRPTDDELAPARVLGERRAVQGVAIESVVGSWHNAERVLLERLLTTGTALTGAEVHEASRRLGVVIDAMTTSTTDAYRELGSEIYYHANQAGVDIVSRLAGGEPLDPAEVERRARMVGVEAHLPHRALAISLLDPDGVEAARARRTVLANLQPHNVGRVLAGSHQGVSLLIFTEGPKALGALTRAVELPDMPDGAFVGIGEPRPRLGEVSASIHEAISAARVAQLTGQRVARYEHAISDVLIAENPLVFRRMIESVLGRVDRLNLIRTLRVFLQNGLSTRATARELQVHENTVAYRIRRITEQMRVENPAELIRPEVLLALRALELLGPTTPADPLTRA